MPQIILEWQPFERMITKESTLMERNLSAIVEYRLDETDHGTRLTRLFAEPTGSIFGRLMVRLMAPLYGRLFGKKVMEAFRDELENDIQPHNGLNSGGQ